MSQQSVAKVALVTGANRGIGLETVRQLAKSGVRTLLAARSRAKAVKAAETLQAEGLPVEALELVVTDADSIALAVSTVSAKYGRLDILVNNAGVMKDDPARKPSEQAMDVWRDTFETNVFGLVATTRAFLPLLGSSPAGRIVNVSSVLASLAMHDDPASPIYDAKVPAYNTSKSAVNAWTLHLAHELRNTQVKVNAVHPGSVKTEMNSDGEMDVIDGAKSSVEMALLDASGPSGSFVHLGHHIPW